MMDPPQYNRVSVNDLLNDAPARGRTARRPSQNRPDIFDVVCDVPGCARKFATEDAVAAHRRRVHPTPTTFVCPDCGTSFSTSPNLNKHIRSVHQKVKPFKCGMCDAVFGFKDGLQRHTRMVHDQIRPFACPHCSLKFKTKAHLTKHSLSLHPEQHRASSMPHAPRAAAASTRVHTHVQQYSQ